MKVLITGALGYVGGRLARHLVKKGFEVYLGSRRFSPTPDWLDKGSSIVIDWMDDNSLMNACENIDVVVHAAGMNAKECSENPEQAFKINGSNTESLVKAASEQSVSKFIYLSTAHVYSNNMSGIISEESNVINLHPYALSKVAGEKATLNNRYNSSMKSIVVRMANAFGAPIDRKVNCWMLVVNDLCRQAAINRKLIIRDPSNIVRNFITMTNVSLGLEFLITYHDKSSHPLICNLGDRTISIGDIASRIKKIYSEHRKTNIELIELSNILSETQHLEFKSSVLTDLGFKPTSNIKQELNALISFCEDEFGLDNDN